MKDVLVGRVDLVRALASGGTDLQEAVAELLGLERRMERPAKREKPGSDWDQSEQTSGSEPEPPPTPVDVPFWQAVEFEALEPVAEREEPLVEPAPSNRPEVRLPPARLAAGASILTQLRRYSAFSDLTGGVDVERTVSRLSKGQWLHRFPRKHRKRWGQTIRVIFDRSRRLAPFWLDQDLVIGRLRRLYPRHGFQLAILEEDSAEPRALLPDDNAGSLGLPEPGTVVLVLGDLGCLARKPEERDRLKRYWMDRGRELRANENPALALVPCHPSRCRDLARLWTILAWEGGSGQDRPPLSDPETEEAARQILTRLSFALRVEPRLVRAVRRMLPEGRADAGIEAFVWQDEAFESRHHEAATFHPERMRSLLSDFFRLPEEERKRSYDLVREVHRDVYAGVWYSELLALERDRDVARGLIDRRELQEAESWCRKRARHLEATGAAIDPAANEPTWFRRVLARLPDSVSQGTAARVLHEIWTQVRPGEETAGMPGFLDPALLPTSSGPERLLALRQSSDRIVAAPFPDEPRTKDAATNPPGSLLGLIRTRNGLIKIEPQNDFWEGGVPPKWASSWGWDQYGAWVEFRVDEVVQRMRWIPPGKFLIGSPEDEEGRYKDEGPQHEAIIVRGFWMFDTPCTQALWQGVIGNNPSHFKGPDRPVERVSWEDSQEFIRRLNERLEGLSLELPGETQWEYACRAGTQTPRYREDPDEIAWCEDNSEYQTHPVGRKTPNDWGLYDTLGNVLEWCADLWRKADSDRPELGEADRASAPRVVRGGSWYDVPRDLRAAYRHGYEPSLLGDLLGFRCAEFRAPGPVGRSAVEKGAGSESERRAEHLGDGAEASGASWLRPGAQGGDLESESFPAITPIRVRTDLEVLTIRPITLPPWASAIGRDRYGLWAEITIEPEAQEPKRTTRTRGSKHAPARPELVPVRQRLRWIPPGRFLMGSPEDEEGRWEGEFLPRETTIEPGFWMFDTPCTQALWEAVMGAGTNPSGFKEEGAERPVESVSWDDCQGFLERLNERLDGLTLRLPSEAQWEYACRAGTSTSRYREDLEAIAWYDGNSGGETHRVGEKAPNAWGLHEMLGNVYEWCADSWHEPGEASPAESAGASAPRVIRGGSWIIAPRHLRAAYRSGDEPSNRAVNLGFRCAEFRSGA